MPLFTARRGNKSSYCRATAKEGKKMGKKKLWTYLIGILAGVVVIFGVKTARAIDFGETLSVSGYVRTELDFHTGVMNPNNADILQDSYKVNLFRNTLSTDLVFK